MEQSEEKKNQQEFKIRLATMNDIEDIININRLSLPENYPYYFFVEHLKDYNEAFFVAEVNGKVVGYVMPRIEWGQSEFTILPKFVRKGHIVSIAVLEPYRRKGIGEALMRSSLKKMKEVYKAEEAYLEVRISNYPAINLYKKLGFREVKILRHYYADGEDAYLMAVTL